MVVFGFFFNGSLERFGKWLDKTKRKSLFAALDKIKEAELMLFGVMSLLMGHWIFIVAKICVKSSLLSSKFFPCALESDLHSVEHVLVSSSNYLNKSVSKMQVKAGSHDYCPEGHESFASKESLEQLHRLMFVLGVTHVSYSFVAIFKQIYSWRVWENEAKALAIHALQDTPLAEPSIQRIRRLSTFIFHHASHPWSQHRALVWLLCFTRQFWSSINRSDYMALRFGFITTHQLPLSYDFHNYMIRSMEEEFRDIVGISLPLWIYTICCTILDFHGNFLLLILLIGTKLHRVVVNLAVEITEESPYMENQQFKLRDELFWFKKPWLLFTFNTTNILPDGSEFKKYVVSRKCEKITICMEKEDSIVDEMHKIDSFSSNSSERSSFKKQNTSFRHLQGNVMQGEDEKLEFPLCVGPVYDSYSDDKKRY
ncbi:hypothetical protein GBA52_025269 [Prunus armeniaca]|nr:hypothetical protein GBA52_025269 [Prunus armeniaca]